MTRHWGLPLNWPNLKFFLLMLGCAVLANWPVADLPVFAPFVIGNTALILVVIRLGLGWGLLAIPLLGWLQPDAKVTVLLALQLVLVWLSLGGRWQLHPLLSLWLLLLGLPLSWPLMLPVQQHDWRWLLLYLGMSALVYLICLRAAHLLHALMALHERRQLPSLARQLSSRIALYSAVPFTLLLSVMLSAGSTLDLSRQLTTLEHEQHRLASQISEKLAAYQSEVSLVAAQLNAADSSPAALLRQLADHRAEYISALIADEQGNVTHFYKDGLVTGSRRSDNVADRAYFREPMRSGQPYISDSFQGRSLGNDQLFAVSVPLTGPDRKGVLEVSVALNALTDSVQVPVPDLVSHRILLDNEGKKIWGTQDDRPLGKRWSVSSRSEPIPRLFLKHQWFNTLGAIRLSQDGIHFILQYRTEWPGWLLTYYQDSYQAIARYHGLLAFALLLTFLLTESIVALTRRFVSPHTASLSLLAEKAEQWQLGDTPLQLPAPTIAEIASMQHSFIQLQQRMNQTHQDLQQAMTHQLGLNEMLEELVRQRTLELTEERDKARELAGIKNRFLANMSHEIRTPITVISGFAEVLSEQVAPAQAELVNKIRQNSVYLQRLIDDVLDTARIDEGKLPLDIQQVPLLPLLEQVASQIGQLARQHGLSFNTEFTAAEALWLSADPFRLQQILLNLGSNAVKFTASGQISLRVVSDQAVLRLEMADQGIGIDTSQLERLFSRFSQADNSTSRLYGGSGLGLYISRQLARAMQMELDAQAGVPQGSVFRLLVPPGLIQTQGSQAPAPAAEPEQATPLLLWRLLLVDDVADIRALLKFYLQPLGFQISEADSGAEALQKASEQTFDLIFMDIQMPAMDGYTTTRELRAAGIQTPVIALSADVLQPRDSDFAPVNAVNPDDDSIFTLRLAKPVRRQQLLQAISTVQQNTLLAGGQSKLPASPHTDPQNRPHLKSQPLLDSPDDEQELVQSYRQSLPAKARQLRDADPKTLAALAHQIKGTSACFGLQTLSERAASLQQALRQQQSGQAELAALLAQLDTDSLPQPPATTVC